ncbi:MAG TPA: ABC transporter permease [Acidimicrobiia bacterium]|nr:ABC transporter permease [Acidimicrobiia bacterium]
MRILAIAIANLQRLFRDRSNIFFVFIFPIGIILLIGAQFGGGGASTVWAVSAGEGELSSALIERLEDTPGAAVDVHSTEEAMFAEVERGRVSAGIAIPADFDAAIAAGENPVVGLVVRPNQGATLSPILQAALREVTATVRVSRVVAAEAEIEVDRAAAAVAPVEVPGVEVTSRSVGESLFPPGTGQFAVGAAQQLVLFVFLTVLAGSAALIQSRQLGVTRRMLSTPTSPNTIVAGEGAGRVATGLVQGLYIVGVTLVVFGVRWGNLLGVSVLLLVFSAVAAGAAMLLGTVFRNDQQAGGLSVLLGLGLAALGGCMLPMELFSPTMRQVAHATPHAWAIDGFSDLVYRGGTLVDVLPEVGVLAVYAAVLLTLASWRLRRVITGG